MKLKIICALFMLLWGEGRVLASVVDVSVELVRFFKSPDGLFLPGNSIFPNVHRITLGKNFATLVIIDDGKAITAAHVFKNASGFKPGKEVAVETNEWGKIQCVAHPCYIRDQLDFDFAVCTSGQFALLRQDGSPVRSTLKFGSISSPPYTIPVDVVVAGYGCHTPACGNLISLGGDYLTYGYLRITSRSKGREVLAEAKSLPKTCTVACYGDSGGPVYLWQKVSSTSKLVEVSGLIAGFAGQKTLVTRLDERIEKWMSSPGSFDKGICKAKGAGGKGDPSGPPIR